MDTRLIVQYQKNSISTGYVIFNIQYFFGFLLFFFFPQAYGIFVWFWEGFLGAGRVG